MAKRKPVWGVQCAKCLTRRLTKKENRLYCPYCQMHPFTKLSVEAN